MPKNFLLCKSKLKTEQFECSRPQKNRQKILKIRKSMIFGAKM